MNSRYCLIKIKEAKGRVSTDFLLQDDNAQLIRDNNWTFDILSKRLFRSILKRIVSHEAVEQFYVVLPDEGDFSEDIMEVDRGSIAAFIAEVKAEVTFVSEAAEVVDMFKTCQPPAYKPVSGF